MDALQTPIPLLVSPSTVRVSSSWYWNGKGLNFFGTVMIVFSLVAFMEPSLLRFVFVKYFAMAVTSAPYFFDKDAYSGDLPAGRKADTIRPEDMKLMMTMYFALQIVIIPFSCCTVSPTT